MAKTSKIFVSTVIQRTWELRMYFSYSSRKKNRFAQNNIHDNNPREPRHNTTSTVRTFGWVGGSLFGLLPRTRSFLLFLFTFSSGVKRDTPSSSVKCLVGGASRDDLLPSFSCSLCFENQYDKENLWFRLLLCFPICYFRL